MNEREIAALRMLEHRTSKRNTLMDWGMRCAALGLTTSPPPRDLETGEPIIDRSVKRMIVRSPTGARTVEIDWS